MPVFRSLECRFRAFLKDTLHQNTLVKNTVLCCTTSLATFQGVAFADSLTLGQFIERAQSIDPWLQSNQFRQDALQAKAVVASSLPDPKLTLGMANLPVDSFSLHQEGMTQLTAVLSQAFPAGDSLAIKGQALVTQASQSPLARVQRKAMLQQEISNLWVDLYRYQTTLTHLEHTRALLVSLEESIGQGYSSAYGRLKQQDLVNSQLGLAKIDERIYQVKQAFSQAQNKLNQYIPDVAQANDFDLSSVHAALEKVTVDDLVPSQLIAHPSVRMMDVQVKMTQLDQSLAQEQFKPEWALNMGYGLRGTDPAGRDRADLASVSVTMSLPFFADDRLNAGVRAAQASESAMLQSRQLLLNELSARMQMVRADLALLDDRIRLYESTLLPGYQQSIEAATNSYSANESGYREIIMAQVAEMNAHIELAQIRAERLKKLSESQFLATTAEGSES